MNNYIVDKDMFLLDDTRRSFGFGCDKITIVNGRGIVKYKAYRRGSKVGKVFASLEDAENYINER